MQLATRNNNLPTPADWTTMLSMAEHLVDSGLLPKHITTPAAAVAIIQRGIELGVPPMYALNNIVYIQGKATTNSELMLALVYRDHGDSAVVFAKSDNTLCEIHYRRRGWPIEHMRPYRFTIEDAKTAGLLSNQTWQKYPAAMLRARAISAVARMAFPDSIAGMYLPEELGANVELDREGGFVIIEDLDPGRAGIPPTPAAQVVDEHGEILDSPKSPHEQLTEDIRRIGAGLDACTTPGHRNILKAEIQKLGLTNDAELAEKYSACTARLKAAEPVAEQGQLVTA